ncbi:MAG: TetR/AcrR family transcriptional regulator [Actinobacteria bacterium]|nr:TetR/AcrR family transcriptional regulator [Actinomycetota bacterium]
MTAAERRAQIIEAVLHLVDEYGIQGTTTARIAASTGVTEPTLYKYFDNRRDMLLAALDVVFDRAEEVVRSCHETDAVGCLRHIGRYHTESTKARRLGFVNPLFEFIVAPPEAGLRDRVRQRSLIIINLLAAIVDEGKAQGRIGPDIDAKRVAWRIMGFYWFEDVSSLMDLPEVVVDGISAEMFEGIVGDILISGD